MSLKYQEFVSLFGPKAFFTNGYWWGKNKRKKSLPLEEIKKKKKEEYCLFVCYLKMIIMMMLKEWNKIVVDVSEIRIFHHFIVLKVFFLPKRQKIEENMLFGKNFVRLWKRDREKKILNLKNRIKNLRRKKTGQKFFYIEWIEEESIKFIKQTATRDR